MLELCGKPRHKARGLHVAGYPECVRFGFDRVHKTLAGTTQRIEFRPPDQADAGPRCSSVLARKSHNACSVIFDVWTVSRSLRREPKMPAGRLRRRFGST